MKNEYELLDKQFRIANYLSCAQLYLKSNVLLKRPLSKSDIKTKLVGHWGSAPGQNFIYTHLNRVICKYDLSMIYISGPGHSGEAMVSNAYMEGTYSEIYTDVPENEEGLTKLCKQYSFPGGAQSHVAPEVPGSIHEGGELGYSLAHAYGAALGNPNLIVACVIGDGESETGPLAASWNICKLMNPLVDGTVLPILHLNGYKIANPTIFSKFTDEELNSYFNALGYHPYIVEVNAEDNMLSHELMAKTLDKVILEIKNFKNMAKINKEFQMPKWPMIILKSPKGWTGVKKYAGKAIEGSFRSHQIPFLINDEVDLKNLETWLRSYDVLDCFTEQGKIKKEITDSLPIGNKRMSASLYANGGKLLKDLVIPDYTKYAFDLQNRGIDASSDMYNLGFFIKDIIKNNKNYMIFGPDEAMSNRFNEVFKVTNRKWNTKIDDNDEMLSYDGQIVDSILSEHICEGMLEGYILTGRHGLMHSYEAFIRVVDSMVSQHAKWLKMCSQIPWRSDISSLNFILTSHCWQQDHNGFTHQDPGFLNHIVTKKPEIVRIYLPFDTNTLLSCYDHVIQTKNYINVIIASKHERPQWLTIEEAKRHCEKGVDIFKWASDENPDLVLACGGDTPTLEVLAASQILRNNIPDIKIRVVNVVDLMKLIPYDVHPHGLTDDEYDALFTKDKPIIFAFHGYPNLIHELTYKRNNQDLHVHGYIEEGTITTPFDMRVQNRLDRYHLVMDALKYLNIDNNKKNNLIEKCNSTLLYHYKYIRENGVDIPEVVNFKWKDINKKDD